MKMGYTGARLCKSLWELRFIPCAVETIENLHTGSGTVFLKVHFGCIVGNWRDQR